MKADNHCIGEYSNSDDFLKEHPVQTDLIPKFVSGNLTKEDYVIINGSKYYFVGVVPAQDAIDDDEDHQDHIVIVPEKAIHIPLNRCNTIDGTYQSSMNE